MQKLYACTNNAVYGLYANQQLLINQYDCLLDSYANNFGCSDEADFDDTYFNFHQLKNWIGRIHSIKGKIITCIDGQGYKHYLQIAPCTHFEGQFPLPRIGDKIYWKGVQDPCGKTYVKIATTCNC